MPRHQAAGAVYHVCTRAARDGELYLDEIDYQLFLLIVGKTLKKLHWICRAYCLCRTITTSSSRRRKRTLRSECT
jgi:hypothetical protein